MSIWRNGSAVSRDGTTITFLSLGEGPGIVVLPGNNRRAHHYRRLAAALSAEHTVHVLDRRGRGDSGPQGDGYSIEREADDALAVLDLTRSAALFGHSYGGLAALHTALRRDLAAVVVYEPGVSIAGNIPSGYFPTFVRRLEAGRHTAAMAAFLRGSRLTPLGNAPGFVFYGLAFLLLHGSDGAETKAMMPSTPAELREVFRLDSDGSRYAAIRSPALLLGGAETPAFLTGALPRLAGVIAGARCEIVAGLDHNAPDLNAPDTVAERIREFVKQATGGFATGRPRSHAEAPPPARP